MHISTHINISPHVPLLQDFKVLFLTKTLSLVHFFDMKYKQNICELCKWHPALSLQITSAWSAYSFSWQRDFWITVIDFSLNGLENKIALEDFTNLHNLKQLLLLLRSMSLISGEEKQPNWPWKTETSGNTNRGRLPAPGMDVQTAAEEAEDADLKAQREAGKIIKSKSNSNQYSSQHCQ